ncbi:MAG: ATP-binding cassette domain-containing protein [Nitrospirota bacterium]
MEIFGLEKVSYTYRDGKKAIDEVSFNVNEGESLTIIGANGSGKSTLMYLLDGLIEPESGRLKVFGKSVSNGFLPKLGMNCALVYYRWALREMRLKNVCSIYSG